MYTEDFLKAFALVMQSEVGPWFNPNDLATQQGLIDTHVHRVGVGYVNIPGDAGGETKFGVAQNMVPSVSVRNLTLEQAKNVYFSHYWLIGHCDKMVAPLSELHFDATVNMGSGAATKILQTALGITADGSFGPLTYSSILAFTDVKSLCSKYLDARQAHYNAIIASRPSDQQFAKGWANRVASLRQWLNTQ